MSWKASRWAGDVTTGSTSGKCVLMVLADAADPFGFVRGSQENLARKAELSVRSFQRHLARLRDRGIVQVWRRMNGKGEWQNLYRLCFDGDPLEKLPRDHVAWDRRFRLHDPAGDGDPSAGPPAMSCRTTRQMKPDQTTGRVRPAATGGGYTDNNRKKPISPRARDAESSARGDMGPGDLRSWTRAMLALHETVGENDWQNWFEPLAPVALVDDWLTIAAPSRSHRDHVCNRWSRELGEALATAFGKSLTVSWTWRPD